MRSGDPPALLVDLYELSMEQAYFDEGLFGRTTFELSIRSLPPERNYLGAARLGDALAWLEGMRYKADDLDYLRTLERFTDGFLEYLGSLRFDGEAHAIPEGEIVFAGEPLLRVTGPLPAAQLAEIYLINQVHFQTMAASKAALGRLPERLHELKSARPAYEVIISPEIQAEAGRFRRNHCR